MFFLGYRLSLLPLLRFHTVWLMLGMGLSAFAQQPMGLSWESVEQGIGSAGSLQPGEVFRISLPRNDLKVAIKAQQIVPLFALESWVGFKRVGKDAVMQGQLVLTSDEVAPAISSLQTNGIEQSGLNQLLLYESPHVVSLRISGRGDPVAMATAIRAALKVAKVSDKLSTEQEDAGSPPDKLGPRTREIENGLGTKGAIMGAVLRFSFPRAERVVEGGVEIPSALGSASVINFMSSDEKKVSTAGELVLIVREVGQVTQTLRENGIEIAALHNCFRAEEPRLFCMRFWSNGEATTLARGLRAALDKMNVKGGEKPNQKTAP